MKMLSLINEIIKKVSPCRVLNSKIKETIEYYGGDFSQLCNGYKNIIKYAVIIIVAIALLSIFKIKVLLLSLIPLTVFFYLYPYLVVWSKKEDIKKSISIEAPFIAMMAYVNSLVDKNLLHTLKELSELSELKIPKIEYSILNKMVNYMNFSHVGALQKRAEIHETDLLGKLYSNYVVSVNLGTTIKDRLKNVLDDTLFDLKESYKNYVEKSAELTEIVFAVLLLLPVVLISFAFTFKISVVQLFLPVLFVPPLLFLVNTIQPSMDYEITYGKYTYILIAIPVILLLPVLSITYKILGVLIIIAITSYFVYKQVKLANDLESSLPILLRELAEYLKLGYTISNGLSKIRLNSKKVSNTIQRSLVDPKYRSPSRLFNITMRILLLLSKTGSSSVALQELANSINEILYAKSSLSRQLKLYDIMVVLTPLMLWLSFITLDKITNDILPENILIAIYSLSASLLFSKISRFVLLYFPIILITLVTISILSIMPPIFINI